MRNQELTRYARWAAAAAALLAIAITGVYLQRRMRQSRAERNGPPAIPAVVEQQSAAFSFSKVEQDQTLFTVSASHAIEFKNSDRSRLDDVSITVFGKQGTRNDRIHAKSCDYQSKSSLMVCEGQTLIDLESAEDSRKNPGKRVMHVETRDISFERTTGRAMTGAPTTFRFPNGTGEARGMEYDSRQGVVVLDKDVHVQLRPEENPAAPVSDIRGSRLDFNRDDLVMRLSGPVRAVRATEVLTAGEIRLLLDSSMHIKRAEAHGSPEVRYTMPAAISTLAANEMSADISAEGNVSRLVATGNAHGQRRASAGGEVDTFSADRVELLNDAGSSLAARPGQLTASGNVVVKSQQQENLRTLKTSALQIQFSPSTRGRARIKNAETLAPAEVELLSGTEKTTVAADRFFATFDAKGQLDLLRGENGVTMDRVSTAAMQDHKSADHAPASGSGRNRSIPKIPGGEESFAPQRITARELTVHYSGGNWTEMEAKGNVRFHQADRSGAAGTARFTQATETIRLEDSAQAGDANSLTTAAVIQLNQSTGEVTATGRVFTVENSSRDENSRALNTSIGNGPVQISADRLEGNSRSGKATYMGHARLWQDDAIVEADTILLDRNAEQLDARGDVKAQLPQKENAGTPSAPGELRAARKNEGGNTGGKTGESAANRSVARSTGATVWMIRAPHLSYSGKDGRVHFETGVSAESSQGKMESQTLDVFMKSGNEGQRGVDHALAAGSVVIQQPGRRGTAERGEYFADDEKYVLSGGQPKLVDDIRGTTTGRSLTYFAGSDTILVDARGGSRTLTEHRIEK